MLDFLVKTSGVAKSLEPPVTLNDLLGNYCETSEKFAYVVSLLERLPQFANEKIKLSNCVISDELPYDSLIGLTKEDLNELWAVMDYLDFPKNLMEKLELVMKNMTMCGKYIINDLFFDPRNTSYWSCMGDIEGLKYARAQGCPWNLGTCAYAAQNGHLECLKYAHTHGCRWDEDTCAYAAFYGHLDCLKYAHRQGCPWDVRTCANAAQNGHLECLKYAHTEGCPWDAWTCTSAAACGHLNCLKYAHAPPVGERCPWDTRTCEYAVKYGHLDCLEYARKHGCPE